MAKIHLPGLVCFIENTDELLKVNQEALKIQTTIPQPAVVVAIVGLYYIGNFYL